MFTIDTSFPLTRRTLLGAVAGCSLSATSALFPLPSRAQVADLGDAINKAGRQRMLSQRMAKAWLALGQQVDTPRAQRILDQSLALFDRQLVELKVYAPTAEVAATYLQLDAAWADYKAALVGWQPAQQRSPNVLKLDARVLALAHQGTMQLEGVSGRPVGKLVNVSGRQRMLSQRMAKFYLACVWGTDTPACQAELDKARSEFIAAHEFLAHAPQTNEAIQRELDIASQQWVLFDNALMHRAGPSLRGLHAHEVLMSSENILQTMDRVTGMYARLGAA